MEIDGDRESKVLRERVGSIMLVIWMATATSALRIALWAANVMTLWYLYGRTTVEREHLRITKIKPQLVVSNGDVLRGIGGYHFLVGVAIWLPLTCVLLFLIYYALLPSQFRKVWERRPQKEQSFGALALLWALALFFMVPGLLTTVPALAIAVVTVVAGLIAARFVDYGGSQIR